MMKISHFSSSCILRKSLELAEDYRDYVNFSAESHSVDGQGQITIFYRNRRTIPGKIRKEVTLMDKPVLHRISKEDEDRLYEEFQRQTREQETDTRRQSSIKRKRLERMEAFTREHSLAADPERGRRLCYETLGEFLAAAQFSYKDLFEITAGENGRRRNLNWPTESAEHFALLADACTEEQRTQILELICRICPERLLKLTADRSLSPSEKLYTASFWRSYSKEDNFNKAMEIQYVDNYKRRARKYSYNSTELGHMPVLSETYGVSLHWLLGLDENTPVLAKHGSTEVIMDYFCLLPESWQSVLSRGLEEAKAGGNT